MNKEQRIKNRLSLDLQSHFYILQNEQQEAAREEEQQELIVFSLHLERQGRVQLGFTYKMVRKIWMILEM
jgi:hypothetical protein